MHCFSSKQSVIRSLVELTNSILNQTPAGRLRSTRTEDTINELKSFVERNPDLSIRKESAEIAVFRTSLTRDLLHPYEIRLVHVPNPNNCNLHHDFVKTICEYFQNF